jgi:hypothetical protein
VSDHIGREQTMFIVFSLGALSILGLGYLGATPVMFILFSGAVYFTWGEIYSLFPSMCTDAFGTKNAATNAGALYTAKGTASASGSAGELPDPDDRQLARRVRRGDADERGCRRHGASRAQADADGAPQEIRRHGGIKRRRAGRAADFSASS